MNYKVVWPKFLFSSARRLSIELGRVREECTRSAEVIAKLASENGRLKQQLTNQENTKTKLKRKLATIEFERNEVYKQYNRLLSRMSILEEAEKTFSPAEVSVNVGDNVRSNEQRIGYHLNVGSGKIRKPGFFNADLDRSVNPDIVLSLEQPLPFTSNTFVSIQAYHVVEHVYPWMVLDMFKEFLRILKAGGEIAIECPNIEFACSWLAMKSEYGLDSQLGMWAIYGDPNLKSHFQMHKWGYTPVSLLEIFKEAGFTGIRREVPKTHVAARDFRMIGFKPET